MDSSRPFLVRALLSSPSLPSCASFFPPFFFFSLKSCLSLWDPLNASFLSLGQHPPSQHAGQLLSAVRGLNPAHAEPESRGCRRGAAKGEGRGPGSASRVGGAGNTGHPCYICACAARLRGQSGRRRQDGVAGDAGDREWGRTRATRAHQRACGRISGASAGS